MKFWKNRKGNIAVMAALTMPMIVGGAGLGVETGYWYYEQLRLQQAADAGAFAADVENQAGNGSSTMLTAATAAAGQNSYTSTTDTIAMVTPSATYPSDTRSVDISLTRQVTRGFSAIFSQTPVTLHVKATAKWAPSSPACLLALSKSAPKSLIFQGSSSMNITGCVVSSNSLASNSIYANGNSSASMPCMTTVGGVDISTSVTYTGCTGPLTDQPVTPDPYRNLTLPTAGTCTNGNNYLPGNTYCGNTNLSGKTLSAGTYIFSGGKVTVSGGQPLVGHNVTLIFLNGAYFDSTGGGTLDLSAPTSGTYSGMVMIGSRTPSGHTYDFAGTVGSYMTGVIYLPADPAQYSGNISGFNGCTQIVAQSIEWTGNANLAVDCSSAGMGQIQVGGAVHLVG